MIRKKEKTPSKHCSSRRSRGFITRRRFLAGAAGAGMSLTLSARAAPGDADARTVRDGLEMSSGIREEGLAGLSPSALSTEISTGISENWIERQADLNKDDTSSNLLW